MSDQDPEKLPAMDLPLPIDPKKQDKGLVSDTDALVIKQGTERNPELLPSQGGPAEPAVALALPSAQPVAGAAPSNATKSPVPPALDSSGLPQIADDTDLIEKEWVEKAKQIVAKTKDDPKRQSEELDKMKTGYIKKRFNRELPADRGK